MHEVLQSLRIALTLDKMTQASAELHPFNRSSQTHAITHNILRIFVFSVKQHVYVIK